MLISGLRPYYRRQTEGRPGRGIDARTWEYQDMFAADNDTSIFPAWFLIGLEWVAVKALRRGLAGWIQYYNFVRGHSSLDDKTPDEVYSCLPRPFSRGRLMPGYPSNFSGLVAYPARQAVQKMGSTSE
jgi:hypothetical protein